MKHGISLDTRRGQVSWRGNSKSLTVTELGLLRVLLESEGKTVSRDTLLSAVWDEVNFGDNNT
ncbi:winged helix-turn-helix domain-containing protein [Alicyclobacillus tolerans]|uniref:winged helix-turn-helix domain-containing protein n=1 Tax=Alicyclobacillus tolerans TaxID=90970 RepID=UPI003B76FA6C